MPVPSASSRSEAGALMMRGDRLVQFFCDFSGCVSLSLTWSVALPLLLC